MDDSRTRRAGNALVRMHLEARSRQAMEGEYDRATWVAAFTPGQVPSVGETVATHLAVTTQSQKKRPVEPITTFKRPNTRLVVTSQRIWRSWLSARVQSDAVVAARKRRQGTKYT